MNIKAIVLPIVLFLFSWPVSADLEPYKDYDLSEALWSTTLVKVNANMGDAYLEGIEKTWVASNKVAVELGQIEEFAIFRSELPASGDFNLMLVVKFANTSDLAPNKARYDAFMKKWGEKRQKESTNIAQKDYPAMRTIVGEYLLREVKMK
jgi:hypothetical protein